MSVQNQEQVFSLLSQHQPMLKQFGVRRVGLFGSFVRGQQTQQSDVDVLVEFETNQKTFDNFMQLIVFLEDVFDRKVDLVTPESLSPYIGSKILQEVKYVTFSS